jgi:hypothetical protein
MNSLACHEAPSLPDSPDTTAKGGKAGFKSEWHDAKEIVLSFDNSSFSCLLVSEKEFAAAYAPKRARPPMESLRLETGRAVGRIGRSWGLSSKRRTPMRSPPALSRPLAMPMSV